MILYKNKKLKSISNSRKAKFGLNPFLYVNKQKVNCYYNIYYYYFLYYVPKPLQQFYYSL